MTQTLRCKGELPTKKSAGYVVYDGPSALDGNRIVSILTLKTKNPKTGPMAQLWILRPDVTPGKAIRNGKDASICGTCPLRAIDGNGKRQTRRCYVNPMGPSSVYKSWRKGNYPLGTVQSLQTALAGRTLRLGAYGDPAALPNDIVTALTSYATKHTGYTHQWLKAPAVWNRSIMASVDSAIGRSWAKSRGYRTFRVRSADEPILPGEISCPASDEMGKRTQCHRCGLCNGSTGPNDRRADIVILAHGTAKRFFGLRQVSA